MRGVGALVVAASLLFAPGGVARASTVDNTDVTARTVTAPSVAHGETAWISVVWAADKTIDEFAMTVTAPADYTVAYPGGRSSSSLYGSSSLAKNVEDFGAFSLTAPYNSDASVTLQLHASWTRANDHKSGAVDTTLTVPLTTYAGPPFTLTTTSVSVSHDTPAWVQLALTGKAPSVDDVRFTVAGPDGLGIVYPGDGTSAGLNGGSGVVAGASDYAGVRLDASALAPGTYPLTVTVSYRDSASETWTGRVSLVVS